MNEMVERVAKQLAALWQFYAPPGNSPDMPYWRDMARAAIEAMREPTKEMIVAAMIQPHPSVAEAGGVIEQGREAVKIDYRAMIDEVLSSSEPQTNIRGRIG